MPFLIELEKVSFIPERQAKEMALKRSLPFSDINDNTSVQEPAHAYFSQKRFSARRFKDYRYDLAILIDYEEKTPPSDKIALSKFKLAAEKFGFYIEFIAAFLSLMHYSFEQRPTLMITPTGFHVLPTRKDGHGLMILKRFLNVQINFFYKKA